MIQYHEAVALINQDPDALYVAQVDGEFITLRGHMMRGFLMASDVIDYFKRF